MRFHQTEKKLPYRDPIQNCSDVREDQVDMISDRAMKCGYPNSPWRLP
jgi:hypothetical protein